MPDQATAFGETSRYRIERRLGQGGMGVVYEAHDRDHGMRVALKTLTRGNAVNIYRFKKEFRALADLSHPNLVALHELAFDGLHWFFTMELVEGENFVDYVREEVTVTAYGQASISQTKPPVPPLDVTRLRDTLRQLVEGVHALHRAGKLHRDLKPSNVLVTPFGRVVVLDFGLVRDDVWQDVDQTLDDQQLFGTPAYMAPEQACGQEGTEASDWYAVGSMLYEALTGRLPFAGSVIEILAQKQRCDPPHPCDVDAEAPRDLGDLCMALLRRDPAERPSGEAVLTRWLQGTPPRRDSTAPPLPAIPALSQLPAHELLIGREKHLELLRRTFESRRAGKPMVVYVHGHSGMGKTALVRRFVNNLAERGQAVVLRGRCYERESVPYKAVDNLIDALSRYLGRLPKDQAAELLPRDILSLARVFPVLRRVKVIANSKRRPAGATEPHVLRQRAFQALKELFNRICDTQPVVLHIDDLQWGDIDSARLLSELLGPPDPPPVLLIVSFRRDDIGGSAFLQEMLRPGAPGEDREILDLRVDRLVYSDSRALALALLGEENPMNKRLARDIAREAEGVPFFINELVRFELARAHDKAERGAVTLEAVLRARMDELPPAAKRLLEVIAVAGQPIEQGVALEAAGSATGERTLLRMLSVAKLIRSRGTRQADPLEMYHDRIRETLLASMSAQELQRHHHRLASALEGWGVHEPERLIAHYREAGEVDKAADATLAAADEAAEKLAFDRAAILYRTGLDLLEQHDPRRMHLLRKLGDAYANAGRGGEAAHAYQEAAAHGSDAHALELQRLAAAQLLRSGRTQEGAALAAMLLRHVGVDYPKSPTHAMAAILWLRTRLRLRGLRFRPRAERQIPARLRERIDTVGALYRETSVLDPVRGVFLQHRYLLDALHAGEPLRVLHGLAWHATVLAMADGYRAKPELDAMLLRLIAMAKELDQPIAWASVRTAQAACALFCGDFAEVTEPAREAEAIYRDECTGMYWELTFLRGILYMGLQGTGDFNAISREAPQRAREAHERRDYYLSRALINNLTIERLVHDDVATAQRLLKDNDAALAGTEYTTFHVWSMLRHADVHLYRGAGIDAWRCAEPGWLAFQRSPSSRSSFLRVAADYMRGRCAVAAALALPDDAHALLTTAWQASDDLQAAASPWGRANAAALRAAIAHQKGIPEEAARYLSEAHRRYLEAGLPLHAASAELRLGELLDGPQGHVHAVQARVALQSHGVARPERWADMWVPGFASTRT